MTIPHKQIPIMAARGMVPVAKAAKACGVHEQTIYKWIRKGALVVERSDGRTVWVQVRSLRQRFKTSATMLEQINAVLGAP